MANNNVLFARLAIHQKCAMAFVAKPWIDTIHETAAAGLSGAGEYSDHDSPEKTSDPSFIVAHKVTLA